MPAKIEREIKLPFPSPESARAAVLAAGCRPLAPRRLQRDCLLDTEDLLLKQRRSALRVRQDGGGTVLTFKGTPTDDAMKVREELETAAGSTEILLEIFGRLGFRPAFRYEKFREEFTHGDITGLIVAIDETPIGTFIELEGDEHRIGEMALALQRTPDAYVRASYRALYEQHCLVRQQPVTDMLFDRDDSSGAGGGRG